MPCQICIEHRRETSESSCDSSDKGGAGKHAETSGNSDSSRYITDCQCAPGYTGAHDSCTGCAQGKYKVDMGGTECTPCPTDHYSPRNSTKSSDCYVAPKVVFVLAMGGNISASQISEEVKAGMLDGIAASLGVDASTMKIVANTDARRRILAVNIQVEVMAADDQSAQALARRTADVAAAAEAAAKQSGLDTTVSATSSVSTLAPGQQATATTPQSPVMTTPVSLTGTLSAAEEEPEPARSQRVFVGAVAGTLSLLTVLMAYAVMYRLRRSGAQTGKQLDVEQDSDLQVNQRALDLSHAPSESAVVRAIVFHQPPDVKVFQQSRPGYTEVSPPSNGPPTYNQLGYVAPPPPSQRGYVAPPPMRPVFDPPARTQEVGNSSSDKPPMQGLLDLWTAFLPASAARAEQPERHTRNSLSSATSTEMYTQDPSLRDVHTGQVFVGKASVATLHEKGFSELVTL